MGSCGWRSVTFLAEMGDGRTGDDGCKSVSNYISVNPSAVSMSFSGLSMESFRIAGRVLIV